MTAARVLFPSIEEARRHTPFFIDEEGIGIWLSTGRTDLPAALPRVRISRDALHIPSVDRSGSALPAGLIAVFLESAEAIGLKDVHAARGYWTLSDTGELQAEPVLIPYSPTPVDRAALRSLAAVILREGNQDAVAYETGGTVQVLTDNVA